MIKKNLVTVFCPPGLESFISPIVDEMRQYYNINLFNTGNKYEFAEAIRHSNLCWFEWCLDHLVEASQFVKCGKYICRMHSYEAFTDKPARVNWNQIDRLIVPNKSVLDVLEMNKMFTANKMSPDTNPQMIPPFINPDIISVIPNSVNTKKFVPKKDKQYSKRIAWVGGINFKKGFDLALHIFNEIRKHDSEFTLHVAGNFQEPRYKLYLDNFMRTNNYKPNVDIYYHGHIKNIDEFLQDMDFILSTSLYESFGLSITEAMSCGVIPLIYGWYGSHNIYPDDLIFNNIDECIKIIKTYENSDMKDIRKNMRKYVVDNFSDDRIFPAIKSMMDYMLYSDVVREKTNNSIMGVDYNKIAKETDLTPEEVKDIVGNIERSGKYANNDNR